MKFKGLLLKESLKNEDILNEIEITKIDTWNVSNTADYQPKVWTAIYFEGEGEKADEMAEKFSDSLKPKWYANFSVGDKVYVIYPGKVFKYDKGDIQKKKEAEDYGKSLGIPESQLDWEE